MEEEPTHRLDIRVERWTKDELNEPGLEHPLMSRTDHYRGTMDDCDLAALAADAPLMLYDNPATAESPFAQRTYHHRTVDGGLIEVVCRGRSLVGDLSPWVNGLPLAAEVFAEPKNLVPRRPSPDPLRPADVMQQTNDEGRS